MATKKKGPEPTVTVYRKGDVVRVAETPEERVKAEFDGFKVDDGGAKPSDKQEPADRKPAPPKSDAK